MRATVMIIVGDVISLILAAFDVVIQLGVKWPLLRCN